jgi:hypothetical protein
MHTDLLSKFCFLTLQTQHPNRFFSCWRETPSSPRLPLLLLLLLLSPSLPSWSLLVVSTTPLSLSCLFLVCTSSMEIMLVMTSLLFLLVKLPISVAPVNLLVFIESIVPLTGMLPRTRPLRACEMAPLHARVRMSFEFRRCRTHRTKCIRSCIGQHTRLFV